MYLSWLYLFHCGIFWIVGGLKNVKYFMWDPLPSIWYPWTKIIKRRVCPVSGFVLGVLVIVKTACLFLALFLFCNTFLFERVWCLCFSSFECAISFSVQHPCLLSVWYLLFYLQLSIGGRFGGRREYWLFCENFRELLKLYLITRRPSSRKLKVSQKDTTANTPHCSGSGTNVLQDFCHFAKK